ncbi:hypothetical protein DICA1_E24674 [Diutina catenulata]
MTKNALSSSLETNRVAELDQLLTVLKPKILAYIDKATPGSPNYQEGTLGTYHEPSVLKEKFFGKNSAAAKLDTTRQGVSDELLQTIDDILEYSVNTWNPGFMDKLYASNNPIGVVGDLVLSVLNTNSHVYTVSPVLSVVENEIGKKYAQMYFGTSTTAGGLTFPGGSWSNITSMHMARALRYPDTKTSGNADYKFAIFTSKHCHYSVEKSAILMGLGSQNVFKVAINDDGTLNVADLEATIEKAKGDGFTPLYINATAGTTVFGSYDAFGDIAAIAKRHNCHFHIDGSWGGNVIFSPTRRERMAGCELADSITVNPHKMLGVANTCSFLLVPKLSLFQTSMSLKAPYLFHGREDDDDNYDLADGTMGCGRRADSLKFYLAWLFYGTEGLGERVDHAYDIVDYFVQKVGRDSRFELVIKEPKCLQVCFYYNPAQDAKADLTEVTRYISRELHRQGRYLVDFSPNPTALDSPEFFRVVFNSPILNQDSIDGLYQAIIDAGEQYLKQ